MFDDLPGTKSVRQRGRGAWLALAVALHAVVGVVTGAASLFAVEPVEPPGLVVVFHDFPPLPAGDPAPSGGPRPRSARPKSSAPKRTVPAALQPTRIAESPADTTLGSEQVSEVTSPTLPSGGEDRASQGPGVGDEQPEGRDTPLQVGGAVEAPIIVSQVKPRYPGHCLRSGVQGRVVLESIVNVAGNIEDVRVLKGHPCLDPAAIEAIHQWKFRPGRLNGLPVRVYFTLTVTFHLK